MNKKIYYFFFFFFQYIQSLFEDPKHIKNILDTDLMMETIKQKNKLALILFYSPSCPHCKKFEPEYIKLSEFFYEKIDFYAINTRIAKYKNKFNIRYVPLLYIYNNGNLQEHIGGEKYNVLVKLINENYLKECTYIKFNNIETFQNYFMNDSTKLNYIIGFFNDDYKLNIFINQTNKKIDFIDFCYYVKIERNDTDKDSNVVLLYNKQRGMNQFVDFRYNISDEVLDNYNQFIYLYSEKIYHFINSSKDLSVLSNEEKDSIIFSFNKPNQIDEIIEKIYLFQMNYGNKYNYVIMNYKNETEGIIYYYERFTSKITNINDLDILNSTQSNEKTYLKSNKKFMAASEVLDTSKIIFYEDENPPLDFAAKLIFFFIYLIIYSIVFFIILIIISDKDDEDSEEY